MKTRVPSLITILIFTLITTVSWIGFTIYRAIVAKPDPVVPKEVIQEFDPNLNKDIINVLKAKTFLTESEIPQTQAVPISSPTPTP